MSIESARENYFVQSLEKGLRVLKAFDSVSNQLSLKILAEKTGLNRATVRRFALTLVDLGYLKLVPDNLFQLTPKVLELADIYLKSNNIPEIAQPILEELTKRTDKPTNIAVLDQTEVVYITWVTPNENFMNQNMRIGSRLPYYCTAIGKAMIAWLPYSERKRLWEASTIKPFTENTIVDFEAFEKDVPEIRSKGYAISDQEYQEGLLSMAIPLFDWQGEVLAAVNIAQYSLKADKDHFIETYLPHLQESVKLISDLLGSRKNNNKLD